MKRVLIVTYYFPPAGGSPVQRVLKYTKYLSAFGWEPVILTVREGAYAVRDASLATQVPEGTTVVRTKAWNPFHWYARFTRKAVDEAITVALINDAALNWKERLARWIRANIFLPDARVGWVPYGRKVGLQLCRTQPFDALLSTGPPHSVHLIARTLHQRTGLPWVADFRDLWTEIDYLEELPQTKLAQRLDARMERRVLNAATAVTTVSPTCKRLLEAKKDPEHIHVIYNGFDESDFVGLEREASSSFTLTYAGSMNASRNCEGFWTALQRLKASGEMPELALCLLGSLDVSVKKSLEAHQLLPFTTMGGQVPHRQVLVQLMKSAVALVVVNRISTAMIGGIVPAKVFEYMRAGPEILCIGPTDSDIANVLSETQTGQVVDYEDVEGMEAFIRKAYRAWKAGQIGQGRDRTALQKYSRRAETGQVGALLDRLLAFPSSDTPPQD